MRRHASDRDVVGDEPLDVQLASGRRQRGRQHVFGEAVAGQKARRAETACAEFFSKRRKRRGLNRLGAAAGHPPRREIEIREVGVFDAAHGEVVREVGREADGAAMP